MHPISEVLRVAVASSQGSQIDLSFGVVDQFLIFDVGNDSVEFVESRSIPFHERIRQFLLDAEEVDPAVDAIDDCQLVVCNDAGATEQQLLSRGIRPLEMACSLVSCLVRIRDQILSPEEPR